MLNIGNPKIIGIAFLIGIIPSLLWLWFWLREDRKNPEPKGLLAMVFFLGMASVLLVLPVQKVVQGFSLPHGWELVAWAGVEELIKFLMVLFIVSNTSQADEPTDWPIYLITVALGFAALENTLFLIKPISLGQTAVGLLTGHLRFLGSTLLHTVSSGVIGVSMGLSFFMDGRRKFLYTIVGIILAIGLHSAFNFFIMKNGGADFLKVFSFLWVGAIIIFLLFEKLRRMDLNNN
ncbi:hypothetical protein A3B01_00040 [Candidatus Nomurabacteria bacterium RIFCSPLOWO2_01_FULL_41_52b]|nr:MAG: hypothetical protein A3B01_00040 [Candidatus Nomurabacteria bacterium RIFCSPLOWO2_01_FULL_41_52b]